jgi:Sulfate permease family
MGEVGASPVRRARPDPLLERAVPVSAELRRYRPPTARRDVLAGVTVAALALPSAMAYGELAGLSPLAGLYTLLLPTLAYVLLGSSKRTRRGKPRMSRYTPNTARQTRTRVVTASSPWSATIPTGKLCSAGWLDIDPEAAAAAPAWRRCHQIANIVKPITATTRRVINAIHPSASLSVNT